MMKKMIANYKSLIAEISEEIKEGVLTEKDQIQVLRSEEAVVQDYHSVEDWYYDSFVMKEELETPLEEMYMKDEFTPEEWQEMVEDQESYKKQYEADQPRLVEMSVKDVLTEMKQMQKLFGK